MTFTAHCLVFDKCWLMFEAYTVISKTSHVFLICLYSLHTAGAPYILYMNMDTFCHQWSLLWLRSGRGWTGRIVKLAAEEAAGADVIAVEYTSNTQICKLYICFFIFCQSSVGQCKTFKCGRKNRKLESCTDPHLRWLKRHLSAL